MKTAFEKIMLQILKANKELRKLAIKEGYDKILSPLGFAKQFGTVRLSFGRRTGKTTFIQKYAKAGDVVIVPNSLMASVLYRGITKVRVFSVGSLKHQPERLRGFVAKNIYIDEPSYVPQILMDEIFAVLARNTDQTFILLGE